MKETQKFGIKNLSNVISATLLKNGPLIKCKKLKELRKTFEVFGRKFISALNIRVQGSKKEKWKSKNKYNDTPLEIVIELKELTDLNLKGFFRPKFKHNMLQSPLDIQKFYRKEKKRYLRNKEEEEIEKMFVKTAQMEIADDESIDPTIQATDCSAARKYFKSIAGRKEIERMRLQGFSVKGNGKFEEFASFLNEHSRKRLYSFEETIIENYATLAKASDVVCSFMAKIVNKILDAPLKLNKKTGRWKWDCELCHHCLVFVLRQFHTGQGRRDKLQLFDDYENIDLNDLFRRHKLDDSDGEDSED